MPGPSTTDRIEKHVVLRASRARVYRALTDAEEFGRWFRVALEGPFVVGETVRGRVTYAGYEHLRFEAVVDRMDPEERFVFRWHPYAVDPTVDYASEPMTVVEFTLAEVPSGTALTVVESGFDRLPAARRAEAFRMNDGGWSIQAENVRQHVEG